MKKEIIIMPRAAEDLQRQSRYIADQNPEAGHRFLLEANKVIQQLCEMPFIGKTYEPSQVRVKNLRTIPVPDFHQHLIFYLPGEKQMTIIRVLHSKRDIENIL